jgi:hypothetical protein
LGDFTEDKSCPCYDVNRAEAAVCCKGSSLLPHGWTNCISGNKRTANMERGRHLGSINGLIAHITNKLQHPESISNTIAALNASVFQSSAGVRSAQDFAVHVRLMFHSQVAKAWVELLAVVVGNEIS